jgi:DNA-directed RNA polymerase subunit RPC12/RpoP
MGSSLLIRTFPHCDRKALEAEITTHTATDAYERGHLYSGSWGSKRGSVYFPTLSKPFENVSSAEDYISDNNDKWESVHAVLAFEMPELPRDHVSETLQSLRTKYNDLSRKFSNFNELVVRADAAKLKSEFKGCEHCSSRINLKRYLAAHYGQIDCPVCRGTFLWKPAHEAAKKRLEEEVKKAKEAVEAQILKELKKLKLEKKLVWVVGGWCPC